MGKDRSQAAGISNRKPQLIEKEKAVEVLKQLLQESKATFVADYRGLTVKEDTALRSKMRNAGITYVVAKNTLIKRASHDVNINCFDPFLEGPTSIAFGSDPVALAKIFSEVNKSTKKLTVKAALLEDKLIDVAQVDTLAKLPSREVLLSQVLAGMQSPMASFAGVASGLLRQTAYVLDQIRSQKESA